MAKGNTAKGFLLAALGGISWGLSGVCSQYLFTQYALSADWLTAVRMVLSGVALLLIAFSRERAKMFRIWGVGRDVWWLLAFGLAGLLLCPYTFLAAIKYSNSATAAVLQSLNVVMMAIVMAVWNKKPMGRGQVLAVLLAIAGTYLIASKGDFHRMDFSCRGAAVRPAGRGGCGFLHPFVPAHHCLLGQSDHHRLGHADRRACAFPFHKGMERPGGIGSYGVDRYCGHCSDRYGSGLFRFPGKRAVHRTGEIDADRVPGTGILHGVFRGGAENADLLGGVDRLRPDPLHGVPFCFGKRGRLTDASQMASPQTMPLLLLFIFPVPAVNPYSVKTIEVQRL